MVVRRCVGPGPNTSPGREVVLLYLFKCRLAALMTVALVVGGLAVPASALADDGHRANDRDDQRVNTVIATIPGGGLGMVVDEQRGRVFVAGAPGNTVAVINEATDTVIAHIPVAAGGFALALDSLHGKVFAVSYIGAIVSVIDEETNTVIKTITLPGFGNSLGIAVDPRREKFHVSVEQ